MANVKEIPVFNKEFSKITFDDMIDYIETYYPDDKTEFKINIYTETKKKGAKNSGYNHLATKRKFCEKYNPSLIPVKKEEEKAKKTDRIANW